MEEAKTISKPQLFKYPTMTKTLGPFKMAVTGGQFTTSEITVLLGQNGTGKTTFIKMLAGIVKPDEEDILIDELSISYKPQTIAPKFEGLVRDLFNIKLKDAWQKPLFKTEVMGPLDMDSLLDNEV